MIAESPAPAESAEKHPKKRLRIRAAAIGSAALLGVGSLGSLTSEAVARGAAEQQMIIGGIEDEALNEDFEESLRVVGLLKEAGFNTLKVIMPWTYPGQGAEINNDLERFQNAVEASRRLGMGFAVTMVPYSPVSGVGQAPETASQMRRFADTAVSYLYAFAEKYPGGHLIIGTGNEINSERFWRPQDEFTAKRAVRTLSIAYPKLKNKAEELGVKVTVVGGELASNKKPYEFIEAMGRAKKELGIKGPIMDVLGYHDYGKANDEAPDVPHPDKSSAGFADYYRLTEAIAESLGDDIPLWHTEYGAKTIIPEDKIGHYSLPPQRMSTLITEAEQESYYSMAVRMSFCQKAGAIMLFNVIDDVDGHWTSGLYRPAPDYEQKSSYDGVRASLIMAGSGEVSC